MLDPPQRAVVDWSGFAFEKMEWLRILIVRNTSFSYEPKHLPNHLRVLDWKEQRETGIVCVIEVRENCW